MYFLLLLVQHLSSKFDLRPSTYPPLLFFDASLTLTIILDQNPINQSLLNLETLKMEEEEEDHKLCGFLCAVLTTTHPLDTTLTLNTRCQIFTQGSDVGFKSDNGVVLSLINPNARALMISVVENSTPPDLGKKTNKKNVERESESVGGNSSTSLSSMKKKKWSRIGVVNGSISVVHQLNALVNHKCLRIDCRVVGVIGNGDCGEIRVLVLVDVYLPIALWSQGWQFPRARSTAAALFRHLR